MNPSPERIKVIFSQVLEKESPAERENLLAEVCKDQPELRQEVESLLRAHEGAGDFLAQTAPVPSLDPVFEPTGARIGRYKLLEKIGEGGFGVVYLAEQQEPVQRKVALKIIKPGMDTKEVIARFEAERQALALMDHPNIARVLDGGATESGRPYFVMELVRGVPITDYCDQNNLSTVERLRLFIKVCQAVQHAHQKAVIHRDLKPSNILVTLHDGEPVPKVIDFGVAKALGQKLTAKTLFTAFRQMIGTPAYMSPEQAEMSGLGIDTRSDIYSLGVLLYELLTGVTPFDGEVLAMAALDEIRRMLRETEPPKPSTRLRTLGDKLAEVAKRRQVEPTSLSRLVRGDLDWIVMKCLEKDRARRYETANGLVRDIQRHLNNEPVSAAAPGTVYRIQKFTIRHRAGLAIAAAFMLLLAAGAVLSTWEAVRARRAERMQVLLRKQAEQARVNETRLREQAQADQKRARTEASKSTEVAGFLKDMLKSVEPSVALGRDSTMLREILDKTAERISKDLTNQPEVQAELSSILGSAYYDLGDFPKAETLHREALRLRRVLFGETNQLVAASLSALADVLSEATMGEREDLAGAENMKRQALAVSRALYGEQHPEVANALRGLGDLLWDEAQQLNNGVKLAEAETVLRDALAMQWKVHGGSDANVDIQNSLTSLAVVLNRRGEINEAEALFRQALEMQRKLWGDEHTEIATTLLRLSLVLTRQRRLAEAESLNRQVVDMRKKLLGSQHPYVASSLEFLSDLLQMEGKLGEAEAVERELLAIRKQKGERASVRALVRLASVLARLGRWQEAATNVTRAIEFQPQDHTLYHMLAPLLAASGDLEGYQQHCQRVVARFGQTKDPVVAERMAKDCLILPNSGADLAVVGQMADSAVTLGKNPPFIPFFHFCKALAEYRQGNFANAVEWASKTLSNQGVGFRDVQAYMVLAMAHYQLNRNDESRTALAKGVEIERAKAPRANVTDLGGDWGDWIIARALMKEAKALTEAQTGSP